MRRSVVESKKKSRGQGNYIRENINELEYGMFSKAVHLEVVDKIKESLFGY